MYPAIFVNRQKQKLSTPDGEFLIMVAGKTKSLAKLCLIVIRILDRD